MNTNAGELDFTDDTIKFRLKDEEDNFVGFYLELGDGTIQFYDSVRMSWISAINLIGHTSPWKLGLIEKLEEDLAILEGRVNIELYDSYFKYDIIDAIITNLPGRDGFILLRKTNPNS